MEQDQKQPAEKTQQVALWAGFSLSNWRKFLRPEPVVGPTMKLFEGWENGGSHPARTNFELPGMLPWDHRARIDRVALMLRADAGVVALLMRELEVELAVGGQSFGKVRSLDFANNGREEIDSLDRFSPLTVYPSFLKSLPIREAFLDFFVEHEAKWAGGKEVEDTALPARQNVDITLHIGPALEEALRTIQTSRELAWKKDDVFREATIRFYLMGTLTLIDW